MKWTVNKGGALIPVICSIDTEEDNREPTRVDVTVTNINELQRHAAMLAEIHVPITYFVTYPVAANSAASNALRRILTAGNSEVAAHLHPWNTPPFIESMDPRNWMLNNLPSASQLAKLQNLTHQIENAFGSSPAAFRAGRSGLGVSTIDVLQQCGYQIDSSVMPFYDLRPMHGPNYIGVPNSAFCLGNVENVVAPFESGNILEIPISSGFSRRPFERWSRVHQKIASHVGRKLRLPGIAARTGLIRKIALRPELETVSDMLTLARRLLEQRVSHLQIMWHSPSLVPGLSPFVRSAADRDLLLRRIRRFIEELRAAAPVKFTTISEAARSLASAQ